MPRTWAEIQADPEFMDLPFEQKSALRDRYFEKVIAPEFSADELQGVKEQFYLKTNGIVSVPGLEQRPIVNGVRAPAPPPPPEPGYQEPPGLIEGTLGKTGRALTMGAGMIADLPGMFVTNTANAMQSVGRYALEKTVPDLASYMPPQSNVQVPSISENATKSYDILTGSRYVPQNDFERAVEKATAFVASAGGLGALSKLAGAAEAAPTTLAGLLNQMAPRTTADLTAAAGAGAGSEMGGLPGAIAGAVGGAVAPGALSYAAKAPTELLGALLKTNPQAVDDFAQLGMRPSTGITSDNKGLQMAQQVISRAPGSTNRMGNYYEGLADDFGRAVENISPQAASKEMAGMQIKAGAEAYKSKFKEISGKLFERLDKYVPEDTPVGLQATRQFIAEKIRPYQSNPEFTDLLPASVRKLDEFFTQKPDAEVPYLLARQLRSDIGEKIGKAPLMADESVGALKQLYGALSGDLRQAASAKGPEALKAFDRANSFYANKFQEVEKLLNSVAKKVPEDAYNWALTGTKNGATQLRGILKTLTPDEREIFTNTAIRNMGVANAGAQNAVGSAYSARTFLTNFNRLAPEAKDALFKPGSTQRLALERLARASSRIKDLDKWINTSNTANYLGWMAVPAAAWFGSPTALLAPAANNAAARLMTNPKFANAFSKVLENPKAVSSGSIRTTLESFLKTLPLAAPQAERNPARILPKSASNTDQILPSQYQR